MSSSEPATPVFQTRSTNLPLERPQPGDSRQRPPRNPNGPPAPDWDPSTFPDHASVMQLLILSLKTPDYGVVNFRSLYCLLEYIVNRMDIAHDRVDLTERPSRELIREAVRWMPDSPGLDKQSKDVVDFRNDKRISALEHKVSTLRLQLEAFHELPTTDRLTERMAENGPEAGRTSRTASPLIEAWQVAQLSKRMDAAEQSLEKAFSVMDELLDAVNKIKKLKQSLMRYIQKWMFNPDAAFQQALNGEAFGDDDEEEDTVVPSKFPFVTWPALREVLINRQADDDGGQTPLSAVLDAFAPLVTVRETADEPGSGRKSGTSGRRSSASARDRSRSVSFPKEREAAASDQAPTTHKEQSKRSLRTLEAKEDGSPIYSPENSSPGSSPRSVSRAGSLRESLDVPSFIAQPDGEVLHSLTKIGNLLKWSKRVEARLNRLEAYLGNVANKDEFKRISDGLEEFRKSMAPLSDWVSEWGPSHIGADLIPAQITNTGLGTPTASGQPNIPLDTVPRQTVTEGTGSRPVSPGFDMHSSEHTLALSAQMRDLVAANDQQRKLLGDLQSRASVMAAELAAVTRAVKEQGAKLPPTPSRIAIQPKLSLPKTEKSPCWFKSEPSETPDEAACTQGPSQSQFEIFCRACAENFQMVETRLAELENAVDYHRNQIETLKEMISRLDRIKADMDQVGNMMSPKVDAAELRHKVDRHQFMEVASILQQKMLDVKDDLKQQGDALHSSICQLDYRLNSELNDGSYEQLLEQTNKNVQLVHNRVIQLESLLHVDSAAGAKRPFVPYKCVSCDKPVDPHPNSRMAGWPHAYVTDSIRPHLEFMKYKMIQSGDSDDAQKLRELKFRNLSVGKQLQRHIREQECLEFKQAANHYGDTKFPHCDNFMRRPAGGKVIGQLRSKSDQISDRNPRKYIEDRLDGFIKKNNLAIQYPKSARLRRSYPPTDIPGYPDMNIHAVANQVPAQPMLFDAAALQPGLVRPKSLDTTSTLEKEKLIAEIKESARTSPIPEAPHIQEAARTDTPAKVDTLRMTLAEIVKSAEIEVVRLVAAELNHDSAVSSLEARTEANELKEASQEAAAPVGQVDESPVNQDDPVAGNPS